MSIGSWNNIAPAKRYVITNEKYESIVSIGLMLCRLKFVRKYNEAGRLTTYANTTPQTANANDAAVNPNILRVFALGIIGMINL
jgi:hypothetical protein